MKIKDFKSIKIGSTDITRVHVGSHIVWERDIGGIPDYYVLAKDLDFEIINGPSSYFKYIGTDDYIIIPETIGGYPVTALKSGEYASMFVDRLDIKGVYCQTDNLTSISRTFFGTTNLTLEVYLNTSNVISMSDMFSNSKAATIIGLENFDTSNVTDMTNMFYNSKATELDVSSFDTSKVTDMSYMFNSSQATTLDLSSFDTSNVTDMTNMFYNSKAITGYARTQADADRFNASSSKPAALTFVVK